MLEAAESMAKEENRAMSELVREALRVCQSERKAWQGIFAVVKPTPGSLASRTTRTWCA